MRTVRDAEALCQAAATEFSTRAQDAICTRGRFHVALAGGSTPRRLFELLGEPPLRQQIEWSGVEFFWGDERSVPPDHKDSNFGMVRDVLLRKISVSDSRVHRIQAEQSNLDQVAFDYQSEIARVFGVSATGIAPSFDLILLGLGTEAHTASLFPGTMALAEQSRWVVPNYVDKFATYRVTMTAVIVNQAALVMFMVAGADKAKALAEVLEGPRDPIRLPAQSIRPAGELIWLVDVAAASELRVTGQI